MSIRRLQFFWQRSSADLALHYHFHILATDGVYTWNKDPRVKPKFHKIKQPTDDEIETVLTGIRDKTIKFLVETKKLTIGGEHPKFADEDPENLGKLKRKSIS